MVSAVKSRATTTVPGCAAPAIDELAGDQAGLRALAEQAGGDEEKLGHGSVLLMPRGMRRAAGKVAAGSQFD
jgi:hypothetical protein